MPATCRKYCHKPYPCSNTFFCPKSALVALFDIRLIVRSLSVGSLLVRRQHPKLGHFSPAKSGPGGSCFWGCTSCEELLYTSARLAPSLPSLSVSVLLARLSSDTTYFHKVLHNLFITPDTYIPLGIYRLFICSRPLHSLQLIELACAKGLFNV